MSKKYQIRLSLFKKVTKDMAIELAEHISDNLNKDFVRSIKVYKQVPNKKTVKTKVDSRYELFKATKIAFMTATRSKPALALREILLVINQTYEQSSKSIR